jgi:hypothetical protein
MDPTVLQRTGLYRVRQPARIPCSIPDALFDALFLQMTSHRDRALPAFYVLTGARAAELLSVPRSRSMSAGS